MKKRSYGDPEAEERRELILSYLRDRVSEGQSYFRSKFIGQELGLTSRQVGSNLAELQSEVDDLVIEKNSRSRSVCWRIERV